MDIKRILKFLKINESTISMILGALVIIIAVFLIVNQFKKTGREEKVQAPETTTTQQTTVTEEGEVPEKIPSTHTVQAGENLWKIAEKYYGSGYNWIDIAKENKLKEPNKIEAGQVLSLPKVPARTKTVTTIQEKTASKFGTPIKENTYTVKRGDHLWGIAVRAYGDGYQWVKIARANKLANPNLIHAGNVLQIPRDN